MPVYAICPQFLSDSCDAKDHVIEDMFYKHFLPKSSCRIIIDKNSVILDALSKNRSKSDVISHFLDRIANDRSARRQATILLDSDSEVLSFDEVVSIIADKFPETGRVVCESEQTYFGSKVELIEGAGALEYMAQDCSAGAGVVVNDKRIYVGGDNYGAANSGDDATVEVLIDKININKELSAVEWDKLLQLLEGSKQQALVLEQSQTESLIDVILEHARNFNFKKVVQLIKGASGPAKLILSSVIGYISGI